MKKKNWSEVEEASGSSMLPAGGYVVRITDVEDFPEKEYLKFTFDVAEGEYAGFFRNDDRPYVHQFVRSYTDKAEPFFKHFLVCLEESTRGKFKIEEWEKTCDESRLVGLELGVVFQVEDYTNTKGEDRKRMNAEGFYAAQDIRNGDFTVPDPKDTREGVPQASGAPADMFDDVPF